MTNPRTGPGQVIRPLVSENVDGDEQRLFVPDHQIPFVIKALAEDLEKLRAVPGKDVLDRQLDELSGFGPEDQ